jgi:hypothetical protein
MLQCRNPNRTKLGIRLADYRRAYERLLYRNSSRPIDPSCIPCIAPEVLPYVDVKYTRSSAQRPDRPRNSAISPSQIRDVQQQLGRSVSIWFHRSALLTGSFVLPCRRVCIMDKSTAVFHRMRLQWTIRILRVPGSPTLGRVSVCCYGQ